MAVSVDLNSDLGEGFGAWRMGDDALIMDHVTSVNIACGFHAGDSEIMIATVEGALRKGIVSGPTPVTRPRRFRQAGDGLPRRRSTLSASTRWGPCRPSPGPGVGDCGT